MDFDFSWIIILLAIGIVSGTWGALIGAGGGFIIVPFLLIFLDNQNPPVPVSSITAISLAAVCINGISSFIGYLRLKRIDFKLGLIFLLASIPSAIAGAIFVNKIGNQFFQFLFGGILIAVAKKFKIPIVAVGLGEKEDDLEIFDSENFASAFVKTN